MTGFDAESFMAKIKDELTQEVKKIVHDVYDDILTFSPSPEGSVGGTSKGSYIKSHRVALDTPDTSVSMVEGDDPDPMATVVAAVSGHEEIDEIITRPDVTVVISNSVEHALDVEIGENWTYVPGYQVYAKAEASLRGKL